MNIQEKIKKWIKETLKLEEVDLVHPKDLKNGDYSFFGGKNANEYAEALRLALNEIEGQAQGDLQKQIEKIEVAGGFINFYLSKNFFAESVKEINEKGADLAKATKDKPSSQRKIIIEYTDPNPLKEFHIGHLMSNTIGESVSRIIETNGAEIKRANYQGDVGIHIACAIWGIKNKGGILGSGDVKDKAKYLGECYSLGAIALKENENLKSEFQDINKKIYDKSDQELNKFYEWGRKISLDYFEIIYKKLGTKFDYYFFESETGERGKQIVLEFLKKGVFEESDGAIVFRGEERDQKLHTRVFVNSQGLPVYEAKDLALAKIKYEKYKYNKSIVVTANEIDEYFKVLLTAMREIFPDLALKTIHLSHGMLRLPTGKMSSRTGDVITAESLIEKVKEEILSRHFQSGEKTKECDFSDTEKDSISEMVAIGAIKYSILRQAIGGNIIFDFDKSISFEGDSGPYLQYACVRANSILEKVPKGTFKMLRSQKVPFGTWETTELEKYLYRFPEIVKRAGKEYAPHYIVTYLTELASIFNSFYAKEKIIDESDPASPYKIALTQAVAHILTSGLHLLGIKVPERM